MRRGRKRKEREERRRRREQGEENREKRRGRREKEEKRRGGYNQKTLPSEVARLRARVDHAVPMSMQYTCCEHREERAKKITDRRDE